MLEILHTTAVVLAIVAAVDVVMILVFSASMLWWVPAWAGMSFMVFAVIMMAMWHPRCLGSCPLTYAQNILRRRMGKKPYVSFVGHLISDYTPWRVVRVRGIYPRLLVYGVIPVFALVRFVLLFI